MMERVRVRELLCGSAVMAIFLFSFLLSRSSAQLPDFNPDESRWISRAHYLADLADPFGPTWDDQYMTRGQPPFGSYVTGAGLLLHGRDLATNPAWDFSLTWEENLAAGNKPIPADLQAARSMSALLTATTAVVLIGIARVYVPFAWALLAGAIFALHPFSRYIGALATADAAFGLLIALAALALSRFARDRRWLWAAATGVLLGLGGATKLSPLAVAAGLSGLACLLAVLPTGLMALTGGRIQGQTGLAAGSPHPNPSPAHWERGSRPRARRPASTWQRLVSTNAPQAGPPLPRIGRGAGGEGRSRATPGIRHHLPLPGLVADPSARRKLAGQGLLIGLAAGLTFVAVYPYLWPDPIGRTVNLFTFRVVEMATQASDWPVMAVPTRLEALRRTGLNFSEHYNLVGTMAEAAHLRVPRLLLQAEVLLAVAGIGVMTRDALRSGWLSAQGLALAVLGGQVVVTILGMRSEFDRYHLPAALLGAVAIGVAVHAIVAVLHQGIIGWRAQGSPVNERMVVRG
ncbi:MAG: phospholipid carrier-dependent glycosyltransferase [Thermomicrobiales bacterium]